LGFRKEADRFTAKAWVAAELPWDKLTC
jgi:hypothetical protein